MLRCVPLLLLFLVLIPFVCADDAPPPAAEGFVWRKYPELHATVQVPDGWHTRILRQKQVAALQLTKQKVTEQGFDTGLTINFAQFDSDEEMGAGLATVGEYMSKLHGSFSKLVESSVGERGGVPTMILEGERTLPDKKDGGIYHTRTVVRIFKKERRIYTIIFGAPAAQWDTEFKTGKVMLSPILFHGVEIDPATKEGGQGTKERK
jgi:hypothetical protein